MTTIDWIILGSYLILTPLIGFFFIQRNRSDSDYFLAGRNLSGWLAGASMAATTFSIE